MVDVALRNTNCRRLEPFTRRRTRILDVGVAEDRHRTRPDARARLETLTETTVDGAVHDRPRDPATSPRTSLRKVSNSLSDRMRAIRPDVTCSTRASVEVEYERELGRQLERHGTGRLVRPRLVAVAFVCHSADDTGRCPSAG